VGVQRDLYWHVMVEFEPVLIDGEEWSCSLDIEWLTWPMRRWQDLNGKSLAESRHPEMVECSLYYYGTHNPASVRRLELSEISPASFMADVSAVAEINYGAGPRSYQVVSQFNLRFTNIVVVPSNLEPKPSSIPEVEAAVAEHIALDGLKAPRSEGWRYVLEPTD